MLHGGDRDFTANFTARLDCWILQLLDISWLRPDNGPWHIELQQWGATGRCGCGQDLLWVITWPTGPSFPSCNHWFGENYPKRTSKTIGSSLISGLFTQSDWWWLEPWNFMTFHSLGNNHHTNWRSPSFFKMGKLHHQPAVNSNFEKLDRMISGVFSH